MMKMPGLMLIDDTQEELQDIQIALNSAGIPCLPILFNREDKGSGLEHVDLESFEPRVIITDLNLRDSTSSSAGDFYPTIAQLLTKINPRKPYVIYFWSKHDSQVDEVMDKVFKAISGKVLLPLGYGVLKKSEFRGEGNSQALQQRLKKLLEETPHFNALYDWESRVSTAAQQTSLTLFELADNQVNEESKGLERLTELQSHLDTVVSSIANEALGSKNAKNAKDAAVDSGLLPVLQDHLHMISSPNELWSKIANRIGNVIELNSQTVASLNSFYLTAQLKEQDSKTTKGVFVPLRNEILDEGPQQLKLENKLGIRLEELMGEEFITRSKLGGTKAEDKQKRQEARDATILGFVELSADCDHAQRKIRLNRYVLGALIPQRFIRLTMHGEGENLRRTAHDGIYRLPEIIHNGETYILKLSFRYQIGTKPISEIGGVPYENKWFGEPILRLREQVLNDISFKCAQYSTRPGIISFR